MLKASDVVVKIRIGSVEEETIESEGTVNCSGEGASKISLPGFEQSIPFEPQQQDHKLVVSSKTMSCSRKFAEPIN